MRASPESVDADAPGDGKGAGAESRAEPQLTQDPLDALAAAAGLPDGEAWWGRLIEERSGEEHPLSVFEAIHEAMAAAHEGFAREQESQEEVQREAHMRRCIREAQKEGLERIVVVCGAWHAPVLTEAAVAGVTAKSDADALKGLARRKTAATWIPWTYDRLSMWSGYGAGVRSPGWYEHLWLHHEQVAERWLSRVARLMREEDLDASPASVIETVRLAESLASMRGRALTGLDELTEATLCVMCHGNALPLRVIERRLIVGNRLGEIPEASPAVPLQQDLTALQRRLRLKVSADEQTLDLDQRKPTDLERSRLLHRLTILGIGWGELSTDYRRRVSTFHEVWRLQWRPEFAVSVIEAARWGNTVESAASACVQERAAGARDLATLTGLLDHVMLADLPRAVERLVGRIRDVSAVSTDVGHLMDGLPALARILRYGNVRKADAALVEPLALALLTRICAGLVPACSSLDDDAAEKMVDRLGAVHTAVATLNREDFAGQWRDELVKLADASVNELVSGRTWRLLLDDGACEPEAAAQRLSLALSPGNDPGAASAWLEGFLSGSGAVLVHDERLLRIIDEWVCALPTETFEQVCPIARRTFATFESPERRMLGERLRAGGAEPRPRRIGSADGYNAERGALVDPVLTLILGEAPS